MFIKGIYSTVEFKVLDFQKPLETMFFVCECLPILGGAWPVCFRHWFSRSAYTPTGIITSGWATMNGGQTLHETIRRLQCARDPGGAKPGPLQDHPEARTRLELGPSMSPSPDNGNRENDPGCFCRFSVPERAPERDISKTKRTIDIQMSTYKNNIL